MMTMRASVAQPASVGAWGRERLTNRTCSLAGGIRRRIGRMAELKKLGSLTCLDPVWIVQVGQLPVSSVLDVPPPPKKHITRHQAMNSPAPRKRHHQRADLPTAAAAAAFSGCCHPPAALQTRGAGSHYLRGGLWEVESVLIMVFAG
jgi:hypothetical protein